MTIAVGFLCADGIVLATDTQYTQQYASFGLKSQGPKLFIAADRPDLAVAVAGAGNVPFMKMAVNKLEDAFKQLSNPSTRDVKDTVEKTLVEFFNRHIYPVPDQRRPDFKLLIGIRTVIGTFGLLETALTSVTSVPLGTYACIGVGNMVTDYALRLTHNFGGVEEAKFLATFGIKAAKDHVNGCGGSTKIYAIRDSPARIERVGHIEVEATENYSQELFQWMRALLDFLDTDNADTDDAGVESITNLLRDSVIEFREKKRARQEKIRSARAKTAAKLAKLPSA